MKRYAFLFLMLMTIGFFQSCQKEEIIEPEQRVAPQLPPQEMFIMPFDAFENTDTSEFKPGQADDKDNDSYLNWFHAGTSVLVWNTVLAVNMALPVAAFAEAFNHQPTYIGNGIFEWRYNVVVASEVYLVSLEGSYVNGSDVFWEMKAEQFGGFDQITWYSGVVSPSQGTATFTLNHKPLNPEPYILIEYQSDASTSESSIRYTNIIPGSSDNGHYIEYRIETDETYNRAYDVFRGNFDDFLEIQWNTPTFEGRVKHPARFNDNNWHCWNTSQMDVEC